MLAELILACAPALDQRLATALIKQESGFNPYAIGMDSKHKVRLSRQPKNMNEAVHTAAHLAKNGYTFSVGLTQIHVSNVSKWRMSWEQAFTPCNSLKVGESILVSFYKTALTAGYRDQHAVYAALRGYNSGSIHAQVSNGYAQSILSQAQRMPVQQIAPKQRAVDGERSEGFE